MKLMNLRKKFRNSTLAVLFAIAVMLVMPATAFADDTDIIDNETTVNAEAENSIENDNDGEAASDAELPDVTEDIADFTAEVSDPHNCYGVCCDKCDENCDGTCCDMCTINRTNSDDVNFPDNSENEVGDEFTSGAGVADDLGGGNNNGLGEENNWSNPYDGTNTDPAFTNPDQNNETVIPAIPNEPIFPDDYNNDDYNSNVTVSEDPGYVYQPEFGNEFTDGDLAGNTDEDRENGEEIIFDDLTGEEEEIIYDDDDLTDDEKSEASEDSDKTSGEEDPDNSDEENSDNATDEENNDDPDNSDDNSTDEEASDSDNPDDVTEEDDPVNSDSAAAGDLDDPDDITDEEDSDDSEEDDLIINVVLPVSISVATNPYNLKVDNDSNFHYEISSPEYSITNYSNCDVSIVATVSVSSEGGIVISSYDLSGNETEFTAFAYIEAANESGEYSDNYSNDANQLAFSSESVSKEILMLADGSNGETIGYFRIKGQAVLPEGVQYSDQAMLNMAITFDINPVGKSVASDDAVEEETEEDENTENSEDVESDESAENGESTESSENAENTESSENVGNDESAENSENTESSENAENTESSEDAESSEITENGENTESSENAENTENSENVESSESAENGENVENPESVENTESSEDAEIIEDVEMIAA